MLLIKTLFYILEWLLKMVLEKLVVVIKCADTNEVLERWQFDVEDDTSNTKENR